MSTVYSPLIFEIHHDQANDQGRSGLIGSPRVADNPVYQSLQREFGEYSPNYSFQSHGTYGGPRSGMALIELGRSYKDWTPQMIEQNTNRLWNTLMQNEGVRSGQRQLHFFVGHGDVVTGQTGAPGEREMNRAVMTSLQQRAKDAGLTNFNFYRSHPVVYGQQGGPKDNWSRARHIFGGGTDELGRWGGDLISAPNLSSSDTPLPSVDPTPARVKARENAMIYKDPPSDWVPGALAQYPGIVASYKGTEASSAPVDMKSPEPAFDIRSRDSDARGGYDPRFDVHPRKR